MGVAEPIELGQQRTQRMAPMQLVGAVGEHQGQALLAQAPGQEGDEAARRAVCPMHVLEHQHHRSRLAQDVEQLQERLEQSQLPSGVKTTVPGAIIVQAGQDRRQLGPATGGDLVQGRMAGADQRAQRAQQRRVGQLPVGLLHALAAQNEVLGLSIRL